jgi:hypothetical protein
MANATVSRQGAINGAVADKAEQEALFLKIFGGEILAAFEQKTIMMDKHTVRSIEHGKSVSFPATGRISSAYHVPGTELVGTVVLANERVITIDGLLVAQAFVADIDDAMNHYDVSSIYSTEMGRQLASVWDQNVLCELILGARAAATVTGLDGGTAIIDADFGSATLATQAAAIGKGLYAAAQAMDEKNVPDEGRYAAFKPAEYYNLVQAVQTGGFSVINSLYGTAGSYSDGKVTRIAGIEILKTNNLPVTDLSAKTFHGVNAATTKGVVWTKEAVGTVKLMDLSVRADYDPRRIGTLLVAKYAIGHGYLRPECCVELKTA